MNQVVKQAAGRFRCAGLGIALVMALAWNGCGGGGGSNPGGGGGTTTTPDLGTLSTVDDTNQYTLKNASSGMVLGIAGQSQAAGASAVQEAAGTTTAEIDWHFIPMNSEEYNIENLLTHQVLGIAGASTVTGAQVLQYADNGTNDHLWKFYLLTDGNYLIQNANSGYYLEDANSGTSSSATIDQGARATSGSGCNCQEWSLTSTGTAAYPSPIAVNVSYSGSDTAAIGIHDPSMIKVGSTYYLYSTHGTLHAHSSTDRVNFGDDGFALSALPSWTNAYTASSGDLWAPDASYHSSSSTPYWLYYAASGFGGTYSAIGLATSTTGVPGTYVDSGAAVYASANCNGSNAIDPTSVVDFTGNTWLAFGSWSSGIQIVPVDSSTGIPTGAACAQLAYHPSGTGIEGSYILAHGGYYYLLASIDDCCNGDTSTYRIVVGRSTSITGPYTDRGGLAMTAGGGTILLSAHGNINGPGGESVLTDTDGEILVYHYYDGNNNGDPALGINHLLFTSDGWPYVE
jgi:arabinan endo-1,5-alpha-L-arabinosidase